MSMNLFQRAALLSTLTLRTCEQMPEDKMEWAPVAGMNTFAWIVRHMCTARVTFSGVISGKPAMNPEEITPERYGTRAQLLELLQKTGPIWIDALRNTPAARLDQELEGPAGFKMTGMDWAMTSLIHESEHRGNLVVHAKANGGSTPDFRAVLAELMAKA